MYSKNCSQIDLRVDYVFSSSSDKLILLLYIIPNMDVEGKIPSYFLNPVFYITLNIAERLNTIEDVYVFLANKLHFRTMQGSCKKVTRFLEKACMVFGRTLQGLFCEYIRIFIRCWFFNLECRLLFFLTPAFKCWFFSSCLYNI